MLQPVRFGNTAPRYQKAVEELDISDKWEVGTRYLARGLRELTQALKEDSVEFSTRLTAIESKLSRSPLSTP